MNQSMPAQHLLPDMPPCTLAGPGADVGLRPGRVHEICGPSRRTLAALFAAYLPGQIFWIQPAHDTEVICAQGLAEFVDPGRLIGVRAPKPTEALWAAEEILRSGMAGVVVVELAHPPGLVPVRRLVLAAEAGAGTGPKPKTGIDITRGAARSDTGRMTALLLTPETGGAAGVESRWHGASDPGGGWRLTRLRARMAPPAAFALAALGAAPRPIPTAHPPAGR